MRRLLHILSLTALMLLLFILPAAGEIIINEVMASNGVYVQGEAHDWVELYNNGKSTVDLSGCFLSDREDKKEKWQFPPKTTLRAGQTLIVYCTGEERSPGSQKVFYANFKLSASGEQVILTDRDGITVLSSLTFPEQYGNVSFGLPSGGDQYLFFAEATPNERNPREGCTGRENAPVLSLAGGFYGEKITVTAAGDEGAALRYTLNGDTPDEKDKLFPAKGLSFSKTGVLRVRAFRKGMVPSPVVSASYFLGEEQPVPVVSLITDETYLFSQRTGALVRGNNKNYPNYEREWEYPVNIEYFNGEGSCEISQLGTFTAAGHSARQNAQKSIALYARKAYGPGSFQFNPFPHRDYEGYKSLLLRGANSDAFSTRLRDPVISSLAAPLDIIYQDALPIEVYINGKYWGHYNLREKINKYFVAQWEGVTDEDDIDAIDILARTGRDEFLQNGDNADWLALCDFCKEKDLNQPENLQYVLDRLDIDSLFTHAIFEIIIGNDDFTNVRVYRVPGGKWKYLLFDVEAGFLSLEKAPMNYYLKRVTDKIQGFRHEPLAALLNVPEMKDQFLRRFAEILEISFQWPFVESHFAPWEETLEVLLPRHLDRWPHFTMKEWRTNVNAVKYYARKRPLTILNHLQKHMKLTDQEMEQFFGPVRTLLEATNEN